MQTAPTNFQSYFEASDHSAQYKLVINGVDYTAEHIQTAPRLVRPMMDKPVIGRVCSATLTVTVRERENITIPKAATVDLYCRMARADGRVSGWLALGKFLVSSRKIKKSLITLTCRDYMLKTGRSYLDKTSLTTWPQTYQAVAEDIASIIGVTLDSRCSFKTGTGFAVDAFPDDILMSEMLAGIAVCNGGNWIMTETGQLRLVPFAKPAASLLQVINRKMMGFTLLEAGVQTISRVILTAHEGEEEYTAGNDTGYTLEANCPFANQTVADYLCNTTDGILKGVTYLPYKMDKAPLNPRIELGDSLWLTVGNGSDYHDYNDYQVVVHSMDSACNPDFQTDVASNFPSETEDEYPYDTVTETQAKRTVTTNGVYYGNSITHTDGFKSVHESGAYAQFNANTLKFVDANGRECFYYDTTDNTFRINVEELDIISEKLDNIGGTNLMINTLEPSVASVEDYPRPGGGTHSSVGGTPSVATHGIRVTAAANQWLSISFGGTNSMNGFVVGKTYTLSFDASYKLLTGYTGTGTYNLAVWAYVNSNLWESWVIRPINSSTAGIEYLNEHHAVTFTVPEGATLFRLFVRMASTSQNYTAAGDYIETANIKLETGEVATAWSPAPGDLVGNDEIISKINVSPEAIQIAANKISLAGKTIDLTSDTISIQSTNFSVTPAGIITATGVNLTGTFNMTGGSINITTQSETYDTIILNYGTFTSKLAPIELKISNTDINRLVTMQAGGIFGYCVENGVEQQHFSLSSLGNLYLGGATNNGHLTLQSKGRAEISLFALANGGSDMYLYNYDPDHSSSSGGYVIRLYATPNNGGTIVLRDNSYIQSIYLNGQSHVLSINDLTGTGRITLTGSQGSVSVKGTGSYYTGMLSGGVSSSDGGALYLSKADGTNTVILNGTAGTFTFTGTSNLLSYSESGGLNLSHNSKHSIMLWPDSNGAGRLVLGDGASTLWRTALTNDGLTFRNSSDAVTASYPASGLQKLTGAVDSTTATGCVYAVPPQTFSSATTQQAAVEALLKYICTNYPNKTSCTFVGNYITTENRRGYELYISSTSTVDSNGLPQYASGIVYEISSTMMIYSINCVNYVVTIAFAVPRINGTEQTNLDNCSETGVYFYQTAAANTPASAGGSLITYKFNSVYSVQLAFSNASGNADATMFIRRRNSSGWLPWQRVRTSVGSDGSGVYLQEILNKNIFIRSLKAIYTANGVTFTPNANGTISIKGTATSAFNITIGQANLPTGYSYEMTGATGGSTSLAYLNIPSTANDTGSGSGVFTVSSSGNKDVRIIVASGAVLDHTFSPMVRVTGSGATYYPYVPRPYNYGAWDTNGSLIDWVNNSGTVRKYPLRTGHTYLVTVTRRNTTDTQYDGQWLCVAHSTNSHLTAIKQPSSTYTISVSSLTLSITTWTAYTNISILDLGGV